MPTRKEMIDALPCACRKKLRRVIYNYASSRSSVFKSKREYYKYLVGYYSINSNESSYYIIFILTGAYDYNPNYFKKFENFKPKENGKA